MKSHKQKSSGGGDQFAFFVICTLVGALFAYMGVQMIFDAQAKPSLDSVNQQRARFASWPSVTGHLDEIDIISHSYKRSRYPTGTDYWPEVKYRYSVGANHFTGDCLRKEINAKDRRGASINLDRDPYFCSDPLTGIKAAKSKLTAFLPSHTVDQRRSKDANDGVYSYFPNRSVLVYYDPEHPETSMLDNNWPPDRWVDYCGDDIFAVGFCFSISLVMFGAVYLCIVISPGAKALPKPVTALNRLPEPIPVEQQWRIDSPARPHHKSRDEEQ